MIVPLTKNGVAVLTPHQWDLVSDKLNSDYKIRGEFLLQTAMRISEAYYVTRHPECLRKENGAIFLPEVKGEEKFGKKRCKQKERAVLLSPKGLQDVLLYFEKNPGLPTYQSMGPAFELAAKESDFDTRSITTKMLRKTFISWLINCYPERRGMIASSAGHTTDTMDAYYLAYGFRKDDVSEMRERTSKWGEA